MPELPEVETIKRDLSLLLTHQPIVDCIFSYPKMVHPGIASLRRHLLGQSIISVGRRGKILVLKLSSSYYLLIHLKMTGQLVWRPQSGRWLVGGHPISKVIDVPNKFTHIILTFKNKSKLYFNDVRRFGYWKLVSSLQAKKIFSKFGPEPLDKEFDWPYLKNKLASHRKSKIKANLLNQAIVAGIGNIYADEILWYARLRPDRRILGLGDLELRSLVKAIKKVIKLGIKWRGTSFSDYLDARGQTGQYWARRVVYGRAGLPCKRCGSLIKKVRVAGRGTHYCPTCQL